jgi:hypothetical protein
MLENCIYTFILRFLNLLKVIKKLPNYGKPAAFSCYNLNSTNYHFLQGSRYYADPGNKA